MDSSSNWAMVRAVVNSSVENLNIGKQGDPGSTSGTLIRRWQGQESEAWERLTYLYFPLIYDWCRRKGLAPEDSRDVSQNVFMSIAKCTMRFQHREGVNSFRGWLWGVTNNHVKYYLRQQVGQPQATGGSSAVRRLADIAKVSETIDDAAEQADARNCEGGVLKRALELMRKDFEEPTWRAFWNTAVEGRPAADVAADLKISTNAVYLAKSRVLRRLREEFEGLIELST
ncbi:MAG: sigma-70 family RNA polymerase sigma factor [Planctomycetes bacterium]|nr:sigma-70 family RNA polymerase sigma factor [Planctomycetota bacterium]